MVPSRSLKYNPDKVTYFAETDSRNRRVKFGIKAKDRTRHVYVIGKTGMGKSTCLENMAVQDIQNGEGLAFIDPHGKTADLLLEYVPKNRIDDVLYFAPFDMEHPVSFNVMEDVGPDKRHLVSNGLMSAFKKIWIDAWSARMEYILNNILLALLEFPGSTLIGVNRMLADKDYRNKVVANVTDTSVKAFWVDEFAKYSDKFMTEAGAAIQNKIGQFISNPLVRNIIGQPKSTFDLRKMMDDRKIIIINLSKGRVGESNANLLGSMLITKIYLAAMSRADVSETVLSTLPNFYLYVDEFQSFANESFADILSEARKYKLNLTMAHQYIEQMSEEVRAAVFGNVGTMITFRVGAYDAEVLEKEFAPQFTAEDLVNLGFSQVYLKLMIDGVSSQPFSAVTLPPIPKPPASLREEIIEHSRKSFARPRAVVEDEIRKWHEPVGRPERPQTRVEGGEARPRPVSGGTPATSGTPQNFRPSAPPPAPRVPGLPPMPAGPSPQTPRTPMPPPRTDTKSALAVAIERETELRKAMSFEHFRPQNTPKPPKKATGEHLVELRKILSTIQKENLHPTKSSPNEDLGGQTGSLQVAPKPKEEVKNEPVPKPPEPEPKKEPSKRESPREIPEETLRKILEVKRPHNG